MDDAAAADRDAVACCVDRALRGEIGDSDRAVAAGEAGAALADQRVDADYVGSGEAQQAVALHGSLRNRDRAASGQRDIAIGGDRASVDIAVGRDRDVARGWWRDGTERTGIQGAYARTGRGSGRR